MEVTKVYQFFIILLLLSGCSSAGGQKSDPMILFELVKSNIYLGRTAPAVDVRKLVTRDILNEAGIPILFIELEDGRNGTLSLFPGENKPSVWLGADGATVTVENGVLVSTRGMDDDLMHSEYKETLWGMHNLGKDYYKKYTYIVEDNRLKPILFKCSFDREDKQAVINVFDNSFSVSILLETCRGKNKDFQNKYWVENNGKVRRSMQFHSKAVGQLLIELL